MELQLGNIERCRTLYAKYLEWAPANAGAWGRWAPGAGRARQAGGAGCRLRLGRCSVRAAARSFLCLPASACARCAGPSSKERANQERAQVAKDQRKGGLLTHSGGSAEHGALRRAAPRCAGLLSWSGAWGRGSARGPSTSSPSPSRCWTCRRPPGRWVLEKNVCLFGPKPKPSALPGIYFPSGILSRRRT